MRRTQAQRSAETRSRILATVVESIDAVGLARTTVQRIAQESCLSVGAVQHHFPARTDLLAAVLERSAENFAAQFEGVEVAEFELAARVRLFCRRAWRHYGSAAFRSTLVILSDAPTPSAEDPRGDAAVRQSAVRAGKVWNRLFGDLELPPHRSRAVRDYAFASLTGLAITNRLQPDRKAAGVQMGLLEVALLAVFEAALNAQARKSA
jgi:AcrR family transcriptional regulator